MSREPIKRILVLSANPKNSTQLRLDQEVREIDDALKGAKNRDQFELKQKWAVRPKDMRRSMLEFEPNIVHFSGHGLGAGGLALEDEVGKARMVSAEALAGMFELCADQVECVVLNACYSETQAEAIVQHIPYVIGMNEAVGDTAALEFAIGFYDALGAGRSIERAYKEGCISIRMAGIPEHLTPVLKQGPKQARSADSAPVLSVASGSTTSTIVEANPIPLLTEKHLSPSQVRTAVVLDEPEGQIPLDSAFYVERPPIELRCYETIVKPGALIRIKAPRQMGKSSLMLRIFNHATEHGYRAISLNLQSAGGQVFSSLDTFLHWFCSRVTRKLNLVDRLPDFWKGVVGSNDKCTDYFEIYLLPQLHVPLTLCLDEVDELFKYPAIASDFFGLLRAWHEESKINPVWRNLRLVITHSKEVYIPLNINQSPFNVGVPIELPQLSREQVTELVQRHGLNWSMAEVEQLMEMVGGHPYLVRVGLYHIAKGEISLERLLQVAPTEEWLYGEHLRRHWLNLEDNADLIGAIRQVVLNHTPVQLGAAKAFKLRSMGLVQFQGNFVVPLCGLYQLYFKEQLESLTEQTPTHKSLHSGRESNLAAIVFTDVTDSTQRMVEDQHQMVDLLERDFKLMRTICQNHEGKVLKSMGDGLLLYFVSAVKAVACAQEIQRELAQVARCSPAHLILRHRIGIHLGEVFFNGEDVLGMGVNMAARLQGKADPGGICISQTVYEVVKDHLCIQIHASVMQTLKGISEPVLLYKVAV